MIGLSVILGLLLCGSLGAILLGRRMTASPWEQRLVGSVVGGVVTLYAVAELLDLAGILWSRTSLLVACGLAMLLSGASRLRETPAAEGPDRADTADGADRASTTDRLLWGDVVAVLATTGFALRTVFDQALFSDWVYHWGVRAEKAFLTHGLPWDFLSGPAPSHPIYPNLLPTVTASAAVLEGEFRQETALLWSVVWLILILLTVRGLLRQLVPTSFERSAILATVAVLLAGFAGRLYLAGSADWLPALAVAMMVGPFLTFTTPSDDSRVRDLSVGVALALTAGAKLEGISLAAAFAVAYLGLSIHRTRRWSWSRFLAVFGPAALVVTPWVIQVRLHAITTAAAAGSFDWSGTEVLLRGVLTTLRDGAWRGFAVAFLAAPFALLWSRRGRWLGIAGIGQCAALYYAYLTAPFDVSMWVWLSLDRMLLQLSPLFIGLLVVVPAQDESLAQRSSSRGSPSR